MVKNGQNRPKSPSGGGGSGITVAGGLNPCGRERGRARARGCKRKLGVISWGKGLINIGLEGRRNEEEEVKRREVAVFNFQSLFPRLRRGEPEPTATLSGDSELEEGTAVPQREANSKAEVRSNLEAAGFSCSNYFYNYIVRQGWINKVTQHSCPVLT